MNTVSLKLSARQLCAPNTVNRFLKEVRTDASISRLFWPRLVKDRSINCGKKVNIKMDDENLKYLRKLKKMIRERYNIFVPYSLLICVLIKLYGGSRSKVLKSLNVKGYKAMAKDFKRRLKGIAEEIKHVLPDIVMLQEFRVGEDSVFLNVLMKDLRCYYNIVYPGAYIYKEHFNNCICIMLVGKNIPSGSRKLRFKHETSDYSLRYNYVQLGDVVYLNAWIPQIFNVQQERKDIASIMWKDILDVARQYYRKDQKFLLAGDLNSFVGGHFEEELIRLSAMLTDCKVNKDAGRPTGQVNVLDYVFVNRYAIQQERISTSIYEPSIKALGLSDHEGLITTIV